jgi:methyltransferase
MPIFWIVLVLVVVQRVAELAYARRNTKALLARGGIEAGHRHYPLIVALHTAWLAALIIFVPANRQPDWGWLSAFIILQLLRVWVIASLGPYWTTRIITVPDVPLVKRGPYRFLRHPNYLVVIGEIAVLPLAFHAYWLALGFSIVNLAVLGWRIKIEERTLGGRRGLGIVADGG